MVTGFLLFPFRAGSHTVPVIRAGARAHNSLFTELPRGGLLGNSQAFGYVIGRSVVKRPLRFNGVSGTFGAESYYYYYQVSLLGKELAVVEEGAGPRPNLVNLNDMNLHLDEPWHDLRGLDVYDANDDQIGSVEDVYVDREQRQARLLDVSAGGVLGVGKKHFLVPVEDVKRDVDAERVTVEHPKDKVTGSPEFDPDEGPKADLQRAVYAYYGRSFPE